ncbi:prepilin peptidase [Patescibacteria group bacterium]|nr:prepilin peptidase [Patescibacteria group bacterium]
MLLLYGLTLLLGLVLGSFVNVLIWRLPRKMSLGGRSICPECRAKIFWYDNIPLISYFLLGRKCRSCMKKISWRYPAVEAGVALAFLILVAASTKCFTSTFIDSSPICEWFGSLWVFSYPYYLVITVFFVTVFVIDLKDRIILDQVSFLGFAIVVAFLLLFRPDFYEVILSGFASASFLLLINLFTKGRGMGLGDVKFALFAGTLLGWPEALVWMFLSFLTGAIVGLILVIRGKVGLKSQIAFGPFLVACVYIVFIIGHYLAKLLYKF